LPNHMGRNR